MPQALCLMKAFISAAASLRPLMPLRSRQSCDDSGMTQCRFWSTLKPFDLLTKVFLKRGSFSTLPYTPRELITSESVACVDADAFARAVLEFEQAKGCAAFISPTWPLHNQKLDSWIRASRRLWQATCDANGSGDIEARPLLAQVAPGRAAIEAPDSLVEGLMDLPVDGVYVQPLALDPVNDSVEKLLRYVRLLEAFEEAGLSVIASRVGAFGVVLAALGISAFDSGLGLAEASNLASLNRKKRQSEQSKKGPKGSRRIYLNPLRTTLAARQAELILGHTGLARRFACNPRLSPVSEAGRVATARSAALPLDA